MATVLTLKEAAKMLGISARTLYNNQPPYCDIPRAKVGKFTRFSAEQIQEFLDVFFVDSVNKSKQKEIKVNIGNNRETKVNKSKIPDSINLLNDFNDLFLYWKSFSNLIQHKNHNDRMIKIYKTRRKQYSHDEIKKAISNYSKILADPTYLCSYGWRLDIFLKQPNAMPVFLDESEPFKNQCRVKADPKVIPWVDPLAAKRKREEEENRKIAEYCKEHGA